MFIDANESQRNGDLKIFKGMKDGLEQDASILGVKVDADNPKDISVDTINILDSDSSSGSGGDVGHLIVDDDENSIFGKRFNEDIGLDLNDMKNFREKAETI